MWTVKQLPTQGTTELRFFFHWNEPKNREKFMKNEKWTASRLYCDCFIVVPNCLCILCINHIYIDGIPSHSLILEFRPKNSTTAECISTKITHRFGKWDFWFDEEQWATESTTNRQIRSLSSTLAPECRRQEKNESRRSQRSASPFCQNTHRICIWIFYLNFFSLQSFVECIESEAEGDTESAFIVIRKRNKFWASATHK